MLAIMIRSRPSSGSLYRLGSLKVLHRAFRAVVDCRPAVRSIDAVPALQFADVPSDCFYLIQPHVHLGRHVAEPPVVGPDAPADGERECDVGMVCGPVDRTHERWAGSGARPMESVALEAPLVIRSSPCFCCSR